MCTVSIVIPAYNLENLIESLLLSIIAQSYKDFEVIVVDDCSSDSTAAVVDNVLRTSGLHYIIVHHEHNKGVSAARNTGLDAANGKYVAFIDGDDCIERDFLLLLVDSIEKYGSDIAFCGCLSRDLNSGNDTRHPSLPTGMCLPSDQALRARINNKYSIEFWAAVYNREFLCRNELRLTDGRSAGEDVEFAVKAISVARKVSFVQDCLYIHRFHAGMGSRASRASSKAMLTRYQHHTDAHFDEATYIQTHATSQAALDLAKYYIMPIAYQRQLAVYAGSQQKKAFYDLLYRKDVRCVLWNSRKFFFAKPEIFIKSVLLLIFPALYYKKYRQRFTLRER